MSAHCCEHDPPQTVIDLPRYRRVLWVALVVNTAMFAIEIIGGIQAGSLSLLADAVDFAGDSLNYGVSLACWPPPWLARPRRHAEGAVHDGLWPVCAGQRPVERVARQRAQRWQ